MSRKLNPRTKVVMPTEAENEAITAAALSDPDAQPLTDDELAQMKPIQERQSQARQRQGLEST
ncbi:MAG: hypothetical protein IGQ88_08200 [Gloeomargaritaceae cyanobacterium C42_A2020_066]|nr:hypothetical protein [Gloeomargaritaceae cyanobacterium C42_A2020_066]